MSDPERAISAALIHLTAARDLLKQAKAPKATAKVRAAITSTQGAQRHAQGMATRTAFGSHVRCPNCNAPRPVHEIGCDRVL